MIRKVNRKTIQFYSDDFYPRSGEAEYVHTMHEYTDEDPRPISIFIDGRPVETLLPPFRFTLNFVDGVIDSYKHEVL